MLGLAVTQIFVSGLHASWVTQPLACSHSDLWDFSGLTSVSCGTFATGLGLFKKPIKMPWGPSFPLDYRSLALSLHFLYFLFTQLTNSTFIINKVLKKRIKTISYICGSSFYSTYQNHFLHDQFKYLNDKNGKSIN